MVKGFGKDGKGIVLHELEVTTSLGTLASLAVLKLAGPSSVDHKFRILRTDVSCYLIDAANTKDVTGLHFGIANGALTAVQIAEAVTSVPTNPNDTIPAEKAMRNVKLLGVLDVRGAPVAGTSFMFVGPEGSPMMVNKHRWTYHPPEMWDWFVFNNTGSDMTTGALATLTATHFGVWVD